MKLLSSVALVCIFTAFNSVVAHEVSPANAGYFSSPLDQARIYWRRWMPPADTPIIAKVIAVHGLGEYIDRYDSVFTGLANAGIMVKGLDTRGHGHTQLENDKWLEYLEDSLFIEGAGPKKLRSFTIKGYTKFKKVYQDMLVLNLINKIDGEDALPTFVFGHSLGGLIALGFTDEMASRIPYLKGVIAQAPAIASPKPIPLYAKIAAAFSKFPFIGELTQPNQLDVSGLVKNNAQVLNAYKNDVMIHNRISVQTVHDILKTAKVLFKHANRFQTPFITYHCIEDTFTSYNASLRYFESVTGTKDKTFKTFSNCGHEIHNEPEYRQAIINDYIDWIKKRVSPGNH